MIRHYRISLALLATWPIPWFFSPSQPATLLTMFLFLLGWAWLGRDMQRAGHRQVLSYVPRLLMSMLPLMVAATGLFVDVVAVRSSAVALIPSDDVMRSAAALLAVTTGLGVAVRLDGRADKMRALVSSPAVWVVVAWLGLCASYLDPAGMWVGRLMVVVGCGASALSAMASAVYLPTSSCP